MQALKPSLSWQLPETAPVGGIFLSRGCQALAGGYGAADAGGGSCAFLPASPQLTWVTSSLSHVSWCEVSCARPELPARLCSVLFFKPYPPGGLQSLVRKVLLTW